MSGRSSVLGAAATMALALATVSALGAAGCTCGDRAGSVGANDAAPAPDNTDAGRPPVTSPADGGNAAALPATWSGAAAPLSPTVRAQMTGSSWREGCPIGLGDLALLTMTYWTFTGTVESGRLVVHADVAGAVLASFEELFAKRFPIERMRLVDEYGADDDTSMAANNTSAFNCRRKTGGTAYSRHAYGDAVDINPVQNPYVEGGLVAPPAGAAHLHRDASEMGLIVKGGDVTSAFEAHGFLWGGDWTAKKDYQHFESE